jgi:hypothetical protein
MMKSLLSKNNTGGSVEAAPPTFVRLTFLNSCTIPTHCPEQKTPRLLSGRYLSVLWSGSAPTHEDQTYEDKTTARHGVFVKCGVFYVTDDCPINRKYNDAYNGHSVGETLQIISVTQGLGETAA